MLNCFGFKTLYAGHLMQPMLCNAAQKRSDDESIWLLQNVMRQGVWMKHDQAKRKYDKAHGCLHDPGDEGNAKQDNTSQFGKTQNNLQFSEK